MGRADDEGKIDLLFRDLRPLTLHWSHVDRPHTVMDSKGGVDQQIEAREEVSMRGWVLLVDCEGGGGGGSIFLVLEDGAGLGHVEGHLLRGVHLDGDTGEGGGGGAGHDLGQLVGDVGRGDVEGGGRVRLRPAPAARPAPDTPTVLLATPTGTTRAVAEDSALSAVVSLLGLELKVIE